MGHSARPSRSPPTPTAIRATAPDHQEQTRPRRRRPRRRAGPRPRHGGRRGQRAGGCPAHRGQLLRERLLQVGHQPSRGGVGGIDAQPGHRPIEPAAGVGHRHRLAGPGGGRDRHDPVGIHELRSNPSRRSRGTTPTGVPGTMILRRITRGRSTDGADIPTPVRRPCYRCATLTGGSMTGRDSTFNGSRHGSLECCAGKRPRISCCRSPFSPAAAGRRPDNVYRMTCRQLSCGSSVAHCAGPGCSQSRNCRGILMCSVVALAHGSTAQSWLINQMSHATPRAQHCSLRGPPGAARCLLFAPPAYRIAEPFAVRY